MVKRIHHLKWFFGLTAAAMLIGGAVAQAQEERWPDCSVRANPEIVIAQCTAAIESGSLAQLSLASAFNNRGLAFAQKDEYGRAMQDLDHSIKLDPDSAWGFNNRCFVRAQFGDAQDGIRDCNIALTLSPHDPFTLDSRGYAHLRLGRYAEAIQDYDQALEIVPKFASALFGRGVAKLKTGDAAGATADFAKANALEHNIAKVMAKLGITP